MPRYQHLVCGGCAIMLMYPVSASCVKCSVCHFVTPVGGAGAGPSSSQNPHGGGGPPPGARGGGAGPSAMQPARPTQTIVIENPPSLDEHGNEVRGASEIVILLTSWVIPKPCLPLFQVTNIAVGVKSDNQ